MTAKPEHAFFQGKIRPIEECRVDVRTNALQYGTAIFEGIRAYWNADTEKMVVFRMREHFARLLDNCKILFLQPPYSEAEMCAIVRDLLKKEKYREDVYIRPYAYYSSLKISPKLVDLEMDFFMYTIPLGDYLDTNRGLRVCVSSWTRVSDNQIPPRGKIVGSYVNSALQKTEAVRNGYDEAIVLTADGHVAEGSAMNLFLVKNGVLSTPSAADDILEGITRHAVITLAREELGIEVRERRIDRTELYTADELFFVGTGAQVAAIGEADHRKIGDGGFGPITTKLKELYDRVVHNKVEKYSRWCEEV